MLFRPVSTENIAVQMTPHPKPHFAYKTSLVATDISEHWEGWLGDVPAWSPHLLASLSSVSVSGRAGARAANGECICSSVGRTSSHAAGCVLFFKIDL